YVTAYRNRVCCLSPAATFAQTMGRLSSLKSEPALPSRLSCVDTFCCDGNSGAAAARTIHPDAVNFGYVTSKLWIASTRRAGLAVKTYSGGSAFPGSGRASRAARATNGVANRVGGWFIGSLAGCVIPE